MKRSFLSALFVLTLAICVAGPSWVARAAAATPAAPAAPAAVTALSVVRAFYETLEDTMKQGQALGFEGRYKKLEPAVTKAFNLPLMARHAVGLTWSKESPENQQKLIKAFSDFSVATYASRFTKYDGEKFEVLGEKPSPSGGTIVETKLVPSDGDAVTLNYLVREDETGAPRIMDVYLDAAISELATRRADFSAVIRRDGFEALVKSLTEKARKMGEPKAS